MKFEYQSTLTVLKKILLPCVLMIIPVVIGKLFITYNMTKLNALIALGIYGSIGMIIYLVITYKNKALYDVLGEDMVNGFLKKLHLKK